MSRGNGAAPPDPLEELDDVIAELEGSEWADEEITAEHYIHAEPGSTVIVDQTGKHRAVKGNEDITQTDHGVPARAQQDSLPEKAAEAVGDVIGRVDTWQRVAALALLVALAAFAAWLRWGR